MKRAKKATIKLDAVTTVEMINPLYEQCSKALAEAQVITIDASKVKMLDVATLQLLLALVREIDAENKQMVWHEPSKEILDRASVLGLATALRLDDNG